MTGLSRSSSSKDKNLDLEDNIYGVLAFVLLLLLLLLLMMIMVIVVVRRRLFPSLSQLSPSSYRETLNTGVHYCDMGLFDDSIAILKKAIYENPNISSVHSNTARAYANKGMFDEAMAEMKISENLIKDNQDRLVHFYISAQVYSLNKETDKSIENLKKAIEIDKLRSIRKAKIDSDFNNIRENQEFVSLTSERV